MQRRDPFGLPRPSRPITTTEVYDEHSQPGVRWTFSLRRSDALTSHLADSMVQRLTETYITGSRLFGSDPVAFPAVGGEPVEISADLFQSVCHVWASQPGAAIPPPGEINWKPEGWDGYSPEEIIAIAAVAPGAWIMLLKASALVNADLKKTSADQSDGPTSQHSE